VGCLVHVTVPGSTSGSTGCLWKWQTVLQILPDESKLVNILVKELSNANNAGVSPSVFFFELLKTSVALVGRGRWRISQTLGPQYPRNHTIT